MRILIRILIGITLLSSMDSLAADRASLLEESLANASQDAQQRYDEVAAPAQEQSLAFAKAFENNERGVINISSGLDTIEATTEAIKAEGQVGSTDLTDGEEASRTISSKNQEEL